MQKKNAILNRYTFLASFIDIDFLRCYFQHGIAGVTNVIDVHCMI